MRFAIFLLLLFCTPALACEKLTSQTYLTVRTEEDAAVMLRWAKQAGLDVRREADDKLVFLVGKEGSAAESSAIRREGMNSKKISGNSIPRQIKIASWGSRLRCA